MALRDYIEILGKHKNPKLDHIQRRICDLASRRFTMADRLAYRNNGKPIGRKSIYWVEGETNPQYEEIKVIFRVYR